MATTKKTPVRRKKAATKASATQTSAKTKAQLKVDELLEGIGTIPKKEDVVTTDKLESVTKEKEEGWIENQLEALTNKIELLEETNEKLIAENQILREKGAVTGGNVSMSNNDFKKGIEQIFFELDDVFTGAKFGTPFHEAKLKPLLNKIVNTFPFLVDSLKRRKEFMVKNQQQGFGQIRR